MSMMEMMDMPIGDIFEAGRQFVCSGEMSTKTLNIGSRVTDMLLEMYAQAADQYFQQAFDALKK